MSAPITLRGTKTRVRSPRFRAQLHRAGPRIKPRGGPLPRTRPSLPPGFFDKLFKLDKGRDKAAVDIQEEARRAESEDQTEEAPGGPGQGDAVPAGKDLVDSKETEGQEVETLNYSVPGDPEGLEIAKDDSQATNTTESNNSIMSFFKTLVSPNKAETKKDPEDTDAEKSPTTSANLKSDKTNFTPQETPGTARSPKGCSPSGAVQSVTGPETSKEGGKEKSGPTSLPLGKLFWKKSVKEDSVTPGAEENTSSSTEKPATPPEPEPAGAAQKGTEASSKDKRPAAETTKQKNSKQEAKEPAPSTEQVPVDANSLQNGGKSPKKLEKPRQSLGGFLKGLGPKRMSDAQVQTDPVSIGPVGKSK
uniref:Brain enriched myelin associated protein 1 n=1 Tax=Marmota marmota marmota TaxID=9994 RepID=A0A8C5Z851_MARMA